MVLENFDNNRARLENQNANVNFIQESGLPLAGLKNKCLEICDSLESSSKMLQKTELFCYILSNAQIALETRDIFAHAIQHGNIMLELRSAWKSKIDTTEMAEILNTNKEAQTRRLYTGDVDFSHTVPDWKAILDLGIVGLLARLETYASRKGLSEEQTEFYRCAVKAYRAVLVYMERLAEQAERISLGNDNMALAAETLRNLTRRAPASLIEAMHLTVIFYYLQTYMEGSFVRSLGNLDQLYFKFYQNDLATGNCSEEELRELIKYFYIKLFAFRNENNIPFYLCGTDAQGQLTFNELTEVLLDVYGELNIPDPKIQIRCHNDIPDAFVKKVMRMIAAGNNSVVFVNDDVVIDSLTAIGQDYADASNYAPVGCYEPSATGKEVACTCSGRINLAKVFEIVMSGGVDMRSGMRYLSYADTVNSFDGFYARLKETVACLVERVMLIINEYEMRYPRINPSPLFSGSMEECVTRGVDVYSGGAKYNNTSISVFGIATLIDSLMAIKTAVFEEHRLTLEEFCEVLKGNWQDAPELYLRCRNKYPKYGNGNAAVDALATEFVEYVSALINGKENGRGGVYRCGFFSINWNYGFGKETAATPDGRKHGDPISKNLSAVVGQDKNGVTGLIRSVGKINFKGIPDGAVLDVVLHKSAVRGEEGITVLLGLLKTYFAFGGMAIQFNILSPEILRKAQENPEEYRTLQIRLCGWNVYFVNLSREEQNEFIAMAEGNGAV